MADSKIEKYMIRVDKICDFCGTHNKIEHVAKEPIDVVACGSCGEYIYISKNIPLQDKDELSDIIKKEIKRKNDAIL